MIMGKQIQVTEDVYDRLMFLKEQRQKKSFTELLRAMTKETSGTDLMLQELSNAYARLKVDVVGHIQDGMFVGIVERARIITINLAKMPPTIRLPYINQVESGMDKLIELTAKPKLTVNEPTKKEAR